MARELHPKGMFRAEIMDHGFDSSKSGTDQFVVRFQTEAGALLGWFALTDRAAEYTLQKIRNMGFQGDDLEALSDGTALRGNFCLIQVDHEAGQNAGDAMRAKVSWVHPEGWSPEVKKNAAAASNARRFNGLLRTIAPAAPPDVPF